MGYALLAVVTFIDYDVKFDISIHKVANTDLGFYYCWISLCYTGNDLKDPS